MHTPQVVTEPTELRGGIAALSNFGFGGTPPLWLSHMQILLKAAWGPLCLLSHTAVKSFFPDTIKNSMACIAVEVHEH